MYVCASFSKLITLKQKINYFTNFPQGWSADQTDSSAADSAVEGYFDSDRLVLRYRVGRKHLTAVGREACHQDHRGQALLLEMDLEASRSEEKPSVGVEIASSALDSVAALASLAETIAEGTAAAVVVAAAAAVDQAVDTYSVYLGDA